jgi:uncharacterized membrane protein YwzB
MEVSFPYYQLQSASGYLFNPLTATFICIFQWILISLLFGYFTKGIKKKMLLIIIALLSIILSALVIGIILETLLGLEYGISSL